MGRHCSHCNRYLPNEWDNNLCQRCDEKGGKLRPENYSGDYGPTWEQDRKIALELYGWRCGVCLMTNDSHRTNPKLFPPKGGLHVHHIRKYWEFDEWSDANAPSNLIPLCAKHHRMVEDGQIDFGQWAGLTAEKLLELSEDDSWSLPQ